MSSPSNRSFGSKKCSCQYIAFVFHPSPDIPRYSFQTHGTEVCSPEITLCSSVPGVSCFSAEANNVVVWLLQISKLKKKANKKATSSQRRAEMVQFSKMSRNGADGACSPLPWFWSDSTEGLVVSHCTHHLSFRLALKFPSVAGPGCPDSSVLGFSPAPWPEAPTALLLLLSSAGTSCLLGASFSSRVINH